MNIGLLKETLSSGDSAEMTIRVGSEGSVPAHFHLTEVGKVTKDFVDCGGVRRCTEVCVLQTYVATDIDHRLAPSKFLGILNKAEVLGMDDKTEVEIEIQGQTIETYAIASATQKGNQLIIQTQAKQTACLAPDACGLPIASPSSPQGDSCCDPQGGCC